MRTMTTKIAAVAAAALAAITLTSCQDSGQKSADAERGRVGSTYDQLVAAQPAHTMSYSPTRATKNFWIDTWGKPGKLSYVYLQSGDGKLLGYYVLEGLPVSYCTSLVPTTDTVERGDTGIAVVPRPSVDGTYSSGGNCNAYYGKDATTGAYIEYTAGLGINVLLYDQPLPNANVAPLGRTRIEDVPK